MGRRVPRAPATSAGARPWMTPSARSHEDRDAARVTFDRVADVYEPVAWVYRAPFRRDEPGPRLACSKWPADGARSAVLGCDVQCTDSAPPLAAHARRAPRRLPGRAPDRRPRSKPSTAPTITTTSSSPPPRFTGSILRCRTPRRRRRRRARRARGRRHRRGASVAGHRWHRGLLRVTAAVVDDGSAARSRSSTSRCTRARAESHACNCHTPRRCSSESIDRGHDDHHFLGSIPAQPALARPREPRGRSVVRPRRWCATR